MWMLQQFEKEISGKPMKLYLMYDIACVLDTHLQVRAVHVLNKLVLFHACWYNNTVHILKVQDENNIA